MINDNLKNIIVPPKVVKPEEPIKNKPQPDNKVNEIVHSESVKIHDPKLIGVMSKTNEEVSQLRIEQAKMKMERLQTQYDLNKVAAAILRSENLLD